MTESDIAAIEERASKATEGPWEVSGFSSAGVHIDNRSGRTVACVREEKTRYARLSNDARFIASARDDIPRLTAAWREQQAEIAAISMLVMGRTENVHDLPGVIEQCLQERMEYQRTIIDQQAEIERLRELLRGSRMCVDECKAGESHRKHLLSRIDAALTKS